MRGHKCWRLDRYRGASTLNASTTILYIGYFRIQGASGDIPILVYQGSALVLDLKKRISECGGLFKHGYTNMNY